jgi:hypothetical protein
MLVYLNIVKSYVQHIARLREPQRSLPAHHPSGGYKRRVFTPALKKSFLLLPITVY